VNAHVAALVVLGTTARVRAVRLVTREPRVRTQLVGGVPATVVRPAGKACGTIVFLNGGTALGCEHPAAQRLIRGMGRAGCCVVAPELPGLKDAQLTPATLDAAVATAAAAPGERLVLFGVSAGASLALLAAADPKLGGRVASVVAIAPWGELEDIVGLARTGLYDGQPHATTPLVRQFVEASLRAAPDIEAAFERLSPLRVADRIVVPVELAAAADDGYFPLAEAQKLAAGLPNARLTVTSLLDHVRLRPALRIWDFLRFWGFTARSFAAAVQRREGHRAAQPLRFLTVGAAGYAVGLLAFAGMHSAGSPYAGASVAAYLFANALMYVGNRYFTFRLGHDGFWAAYGRYIAVGILVAAVNAGLLAVLVNQTGVDARLGQALSLLAIAPAAFLAFKRWTFGAHP
jgi:putative flippase GtrA/acetyl esterase/lipase